MMNVASNLDATARRQPHATAMVYRGQRYRYADLDRMASRVACGLTAHGIGRGDRVALYCSNRPGFVIAYFGILKTGACAVMLETGLTSRDLVTELRDSEARALFAFDGLGDTAHGERALAAVDEAEECDHLWLIPGDPMGPTTIPEVPSLATLMGNHPDRFNTVVCGKNELAQLVYTSGSTGRPKGIEITHGNLSAMVMINLAIIDRSDTNVRLVTSPLFHITGQVFSMNLAALCGETMVLLERFDPGEVWRLVVEEGINHLLAMPVYYRKLLDSAAKVNEKQVMQSLRFCCTGGAPLPSTWSDAFEDRFGVPIISAYGLTETSGIVAWNHPFDRQKRDGVGRPVPGVEVRLVGSNWQPVSNGDAGEIAVRSPGVMKGYLGLPGLTAQVLRDGWLRTGDVGEMDCDGTLYVRGRMSGMIIRGHEHIYPAEIENALYRHPFVSQATTVAFPDEVLGQDVKALVVLKQGCAIDRDDLLHWLSGELPDGKCPSDLEFLSALPLTETGKIASRLLGERH